MAKPKTLMIDDVEYVRADSIKQEYVEFTGDETLATRMIGKKVIVRTRNEGINIGIVVLADETGVELSNCRRIWYHRPKDENLSWYEGVAMTGLSDDSKVSGTVDRKIIIEDYSMTECADEAFSSIMEKTPNGQN
jgi:hypothetical protein